MFAMMQNEVFSNIIWLQAFSTETLLAKIILVVVDGVVIQEFVEHRNIFGAATLLLSKRASTRDARNNASNKRCNFQNQQSEVVRQNVPCCSEHCN